MSVEEDPTGLGAALRGNTERRRSRFESGTSERSDGVDAFEKQFKGRTGAERALDII